VRLPLLRILVILGLCVSSASAQQSAPKSNSTREMLKVSAAEQAVWNEEEAYWRSLKAGDRESYLSLWDEGFAGWPRTESEPIHKDRIREDLKQVRDDSIFNRKVLDYKMEPLSVREYGDNIVITLYRATIHSTDSNGKDEQTRRARLTHTWMKTDQRWQIIGGMSAEDTRRPQQPAPSPSSNLKEEIARIDDERREAYLHNDAATLDRILADDVTMITGMGGEDDKHSILADVGSHDLVYERLSYSKREIRLYGDTAIVTSHADIIGNYKGKRLSGKLLVTRVYTKENGSWRLVAIQSTRTSEP